MTAALNALHVAVIVATCVMLAADIGHLYVRLAAVAYLMFRAWYDAHQEAGQ